MWNIVWKWKFPNHSKVGVDTSASTLVEIDWGLHWDNVVLIPTDANDQDMVLSEMYGFESQVWEIINQIVTDGIQDYLTHKAETETLDSTESENLGYKARNLVAETSKLAREMLLQANAIEDTIEYIENTVEIDDEEVWEDFIFKAMKAVLEPYRLRIFELLVRNENRLKKKRGIK